MHLLKKFAIIALVAILSFHVFYSNNHGLQINNRLDMPSLDSEGIDIVDRQDGNGGSKPLRRNTHSDSGTTGVLNPLDVEQTGFISTGTTNARTDTSFNTNTTLGIDTANDWMASEASADIWNLERRYAVNGTFDDGVPGQYIVVNETPVYYPYGWTASNVSTDAEQTQVAGYNDDGFAIAENQGKKSGGGSGSDIFYDHIAGTKVLWKQNITNTPYTENFVLNFRYLYSRGPLYRQGGDDIGGNCSLSVFVDGSVVWNQPLPYVTERGVWIETGDIPINIADANDTLEFAIGITIDETMNLNAEKDYDNDGVEDGLANTVYITTNIDDVSFTGLNPPSFEEVDFTFHVGNDTTPATGSSGNGSATIPNTEYWSTDQLDIAFTSNASISFGYEAFLLEHRFRNSSSTTSKKEEGVEYTIYHNQSAELRVYTYVGTQANYQHFNVTMRFPDDWENVTVEDPFLNDATNQCIITPNNLTIPTPLLESLGWWKVTFQSPNYAKSLSPQKYVDSSEWTTSEEFRPGNITRASVELGTESETPMISDPVNLTWHLPNGSVWWSESSTSGTAGSLNSNPIAFGATNTSAGEWYIEMEWMNGSEIAYASSSFSLYHIASLMPEYSTLDGDVGQTITNVLRFQNGYTGEYLMSDDATLVGNWSGDSVQFAPNVVKNWWEGDFDTSLSGGGNFTVLVQASKPFYDDVNCTFHIVATYTTQMETDAPSDIAAEIGLNEVYNLNLSYQLSDNTGIEGATISVNYTGPTDGLDVDSPVPQSAGEYQVTMTGKKSGTYVVTVETSKRFHHPQSDSFTLIVGKTATELTPVNGTADSIRFGEPYNLVVRYVNSSEYGLLGADVTISSVLPESGLEYGATQEIGDGYYGLPLTPDSADTYTIVVKANLTNHETQYTTFSLTVSEIPTSLTSIPSSSTIAFDLNETVKLIFEDENLNRLEGATITVLNIPEGLEISGISERGNGTYEVVLNASEVGSYSILLRASLTNYQNSTVGFSLLVKEIPTELLFLESDGSASVNFSDPFTIEMVYARTDLNQNVTGANINITLSQPDGPPFTLTPVGEIYRIMFGTEYIGSWIIDIKATRENYEPKTREFKLTIQEIQTRITDLTLQDDLLYDHTYTLDYDYLVSFNQTGINGADVSVSGIDDDWVQIFYPGDGLYRINLTPTSLGTYSAVFSFSKMGYASQTSSLEFHVDEVPVGISLLDELTDIAQEEKTLRIRVYERETDTPVSDATVTYVIFGSERGLWREGTFTEEADGIYSATFTMPPADNQDYHIKIRMDKSNYVLEEDSGVYSISPYLSDEALMGQFVTTYMLPFSVIGAGLIIAYGAYVLYRRKKHERIVQQNRIKRVFTDAQNLLGVLILNTESGVPLYSRIIKEELDDTVISAFISAITQFKSEFDLASPYEEWEVTPISDLIRIVATNDLICAFIVVREPSETQKEKMKLFAQKVDSIWSEVYQTTPSEVLDSTTKRKFDKLFDDVLDASLLKTYEVVDESQLPEELRDLEDKIEGLDEDNLDLTKLAQSLAARGIEEREAYTLIMDALKKHAITETDETAPGRL